MVALSSGLLAAHVRGRIAREEQSRERGVFRAPGLPLSGAPLACALADAPCFGQNPPPKGLGG